MGNESSHPRRIDIGNALATCIALYQSDLPKAKGALESIRRKEMLQHTITDYAQCEGQRLIWNIAHVKSDDVIIVGFRSTFSFEHLVEDSFATKANALGMEGKIRSGFLDLASTVPTETFLEFLAGDEATGRPKKKVILCGHSIGGSIAVVALCLLLVNETFRKLEISPGDVRCVTFGAPDAGDQVFMKFMQEKREIDKYLFQYRTEFDIVPALFNALHDQREAISENTQDFRDISQVFLDKLSVSLKELDRLSEDQMDDLVAPAHQLLINLSGLPGNEDGFLAYESEFGSRCIISRRDGVIDFSEDAVLLPRPFPMELGKIKNGIGQHALTLYILYFSIKFDMQIIPRLPVDGGAQTPEPPTPVVEFDVFGTDHFSDYVEVSRTRPSQKAEDEGLGSKIGVEVSHPFACLIVSARIDTWDMDILEMKSAHVLGRRARGVRQLNATQDAQIDNIPLHVTLQTVFREIVIENKFPKLYSCYREAKFANLSPVACLACTLPVACGDGAACRSVRDLILQIAPNMGQDIAAIQDILRRQSAKITADSIGMHTQDTLETIQRVDQHLQSEQDDTKTRENSVIAREHAGIRGAQASTITNTVAKSGAAGVGATGVLGYLAGGTAAAIGGGVVFGGALLAGAGYGIYKVYSRYASKEEQEKRDDREQRIRWLDVLQQRYPEQCKEKTRYSSNLSWLDIQRICFEDETLDGNLEQIEEQKMAEERSQPVSPLEVFRARWTDTSILKQFLDKTGKSKEVIDAAEKELKRNLMILKHSYQIYRILARQKIIGVVGTKSAGKTTLCNELFRHPAVGGKANDSVYPYANAIPGDIIVIDFPHNHIQDWTEGYRKLYETLLDLVIIVLDANKRGCEGEEKIYEKLSTSVPRNNVIVLFNKCDEVIKEVQVDRVAKRARKRGFQRRGAKGEPGQANRGGSGVKSKEYSYKIMSNVEFNAWKETCRRNVVDDEEMFGNVMFTSINVAAFREYDQLFDEYDDRMRGEGKENEGDYQAIERDAETLSDVLSECREIQTCGHILEMVSGKLELSDDRHDELGDFCFAEEGSV